MVAIFPRHPSAAEALNRPSVLLHHCGEMPSKVFDKAVYVARRKLIFGLLVYLTAVLCSAMSIPRDISAALSRSSCRISPQWWSRREGLFNTSAADGCLGKIATTCLIFGLDD